MPRSPAAATNPAAAAQAPPALSHAPGEQHDHARGYDYGCPACNPALDIEALRKDA